jgi:hypothetical protein
MQPQTELRFTLQCRRHFRPSSSTDSSSCRSIAARHEIARTRPNEAYRHTLRAIAFPLIAAKLAPLGTSLTMRTTPVYSFSDCMVREGEEIVPEERVDVTMINEGFANPQPILDIRVSNERDACGAIAD